MWCDMIRFFNLRCVRSALADTPCVAGSFAIILWARVLRRVRVEVKRFMGCTVQRLVTSLSQMGQVRVFSVLPSFENIWFVGDPTMEATRASLRNLEGSTRVATQWSSVAAT